MSRIEHAKLWFAAALIATILHILGWTYRFSYLDGEERVRELLERRKPVVIAFWHDRQFLFAYFLRRTFLRRGFGLAAMSSHSRDGELGAKLGRLFGVRIVRGSSSRGGTRGLRELYRTVARSGCSPLLTPDGPRGPSHRFKTGGLVLAQAARVPIVPFTFAARRSWRLGSWDRLIVPKPFTRVLLAVGEPIDVGAGLHDAELEKRRRHLERVMRDQVEAVEDAQLFFATDVSTP
jgi:lysophospholipid acyltransferase (LPLAT)-like uncharacterized protein